MESGDNRTAVCIIGGGPGGVAMSGYLNQLQIPHILFEAATFPRDKACGDTISIHVVNYIKKLFPEAYERLQKEKALTDVYGLNVFAPNYARLHFRYPDLAHFEGKPSSYTVRRDRFDHILLEACKESKYATVYDGTKVTDVEIQQEGAVIKTSKGNFNCDLVVMASGCNGSLAPKFNGNKKESQHFALGIRGYFENVKETNEGFSELFLSKDTFLGGFYISCLGNNLFNVNMVMKKGSVEYKGVKYREHFFNQIEQHPLLKEKFKDAQLIGNLEGHGLMLGTKKRKISGDRMLFIGDAAGLIDIATANGIPQAMKSARFASETIAQAIKEKRFDEAFLSNYDRTTYKKLKGELKAGRMLARLFRKNSSYKTAIWLTNFFFKSNIMPRLLSIGVYGLTPKKNRSVQ